MASGNMSLESGNPEVRGSDKKKEKKRKKNGVPLLTAPRRALGWISISAESTRSSLAPYLIRYI